MPLALDRPLIIFDLETTGTNLAADRIIEFAGIKMYPDNVQEEYHFLVNPGIPIPAQATAVHGISDSDVAHLPRLEEKIAELESFFKNSDVSGFNVYIFDLPFLFAEVMRCGGKLDIGQMHIVDVMKIYHKRERRDLSAAYRFYCNAELKNAHSALADTRATRDILLAQVEKYHDLPKNVQELHTYSIGPQKADPFKKVYVDDNGEARINFGNYRGKTFREVHKADNKYFQWMIGNVLTEYSKEIVRLHWKKNLSTVSMESNEKRE